MAGVDDIVAARAATVKPTAANISPTGYESLAQTAAELGLDVTPLQVLRLIALKLLAGTRRGNGGEWLVNAKDLAGYIAKGCPNLAMPPVDATWFHGAGFPANDFLTKLVREIQKNVPLERPTWDRLRGAADVILKPSREMLALVLQPTKVIPTWDNPYPTLGLAFAVDRLQSLAAQSSLAAPAPARVPSLEALYSENFDEIVADAKKRFFVGQAGISVTYPAIVGAKPGTADAVEITTSVGVKWSSLFTQGDVDAAVKLAF